MRDNIEQPPHSFDTLNRQSRLQAISLQHRQAHINTADFVTAEPTLPNQTSTLILFKQCLSNTAVVDGQIAV